MRWITPSQDILIRTKRMRRLRRLVGARHRPRLHCHRGQGGGGAMRKREGLTQGDGRPRRFSWSAHGHWKTKYGNRIVSQLKKLGTSCDWEPRALYHGRGLL
ncbi:MAG: hypothetical protein ACLT9S_11235 [Faecalibacterium sp.]